ncbi:hypothetical protein AAMO2058_001081900 [Amorphochlora amoebiformis]
MAPKQRPGRSVQEASVSRKPKVSGKEKDPILKLRHILSAPTQGEPCDSPTYIDRRSAAAFKIPFEALTWKGVEGEVIAERVMEAYLFAEADPYRAPTHNKGLEGYRGVLSCHAAACSGGAYGGRRMEDYDRCCHSHLTQALVEKGCEVNRISERCEATCNKWMNIAIGRISGFIFSVGEERGYHSNNVPFGRFLMVEGPIFKTSTAISRRMSTARKVLPDASMDVGNILKHSHKHFDLQHPRILLDAMNHYGVVSALIMNAGLRLYEKTPIGMPQRLEKIVGIIFILSVTVSVLSGAYTTVVFALIGMYSKTALGLHLTDEYLEFIKATRVFRQSGYINFLVCLYSFCVSFSLSIFLRAPLWSRWIGLILSLIGIVEASNQWNKIIRLASALIGAQLPPGTPFLRWWN